jgi:hypothetical protein
MFVYNSLSGGSKGFSAVKKNLIFAAFVFASVIGLAGAVSGQASDSGKSALRYDLESMMTSGNQFYVAPNGSPSGDGSINSPWDLKTALSQPSAVTPGSTIYLRGGVYNVPTVELGFTSRLTGTPDNPIIVTSYPGEWAVIDGNLSHSTVKNVTILTINGHHSWFVNFEITNTETSNRKIPTSTSNPSSRRGSSVYDYGKGTKIINLVIHDTGQGIGAWQQGENNEYYGNIIFNNGWDAPDRTHGHATYVHNNVGTKRFEHNIFFNAFSMNGRTGGTEAAHVHNIDFIENTFFNGILSWKGPNIKNFRVINNYFYNNPLKVGDEINHTYHSAEIRDNYAMSGVQLFEFTEHVTLKNNTVWNNEPQGKNLVLSHVSSKIAGKFSIDNNFYYKAFDLYPYWQFKINYYGVRQFQLRKRTGYLAFNKTTGSQTTTYSYTKRSWTDDIGFDRNSTYFDHAPTGVKYFIQPNKYDARRAHLIIYNWDQADTVNIDVSSVLSPGDTYKLINVQDYFNDVTTGTYSGGALPIAMVGKTRAKPIGYDEVTSWYHDPLQPNTFPTFGVFVLIKTN